MRPWPKQRDTKGEAGSAARRALERVLPLAIQHVRALPPTLQDDAVFAFTNAYKLAAQAELDDVRILEMTMSLVERRRTLNDVPSPQSPMIAKRLEEDKDRFNISRAQVETSVVDNANRALEQLNPLSQALGSPACEPVEMRFS